MKLNTKWNEKMIFTATADDHSVAMDTKPPVGSDSALSPKQLMLAGITGCTGMDVVSLLKKYKEPIETFDIEAESVPTEGVYPAVFKSVHLKFKLSGKLDPKKVIEAVTLSQTKYCGVSAMISKSVPITYDVELNGANIGTGSAKFY